jgi:type II secretory pathway component GspD/PulD (secretin)
LPILGDLPFLGKFFTHRYKERDKDRELLVFITPHIIKDMSVQLAQAKKGVLPEREQSATSRVSRQAVIDASLKSFEKKKK